MAGSFLDTTVLVDAADSVEPAKGTSEKFIVAHQPSEVAFYALRELLAGRIRYLCTAHNILLGAQNHPEALLAILRRSPAEGRAREALVRIVTESLKEAFGDEGLAPGDYKREALGWLALKTAQLWSRARKLKHVVHVQSLACFNNGKLSYGEGGELRGPRNAFNCLERERCAAAAYIYDDGAKLSKLLDALHEKNLEEHARTKRENQQRRRALRHLRVQGPKEFDKRRCRALGDAYFAAMCPPSYSIATTNLADYE